MNAVVNESRYHPDDESIEALKVPPHSLQAEQSVLGGLMLDNQAWELVADKVIAVDFYDKNHQRIFTAINQLAEQQIPFDVVTLSEQLKNTIRFSNDLSCLGYLGLLARDTPSAANIVAYADIVRERSVLRQLIQVSTKIGNTAFAPQGLSAFEVLENAERAVLKIAEQAQRKGGFKAIKPILAGVVDRVQTLFEQESHITGLPTGFADLDDKTSGLQPADLIIIAGRPSMGKTSCAMNIAEHVAVYQKVPVAVFSMEMPAEALGLRMLSSIGRIDQLKVRAGKLDENDWPRMTSAINILANAKLFIDDTAALSPTELSARARRLAREQGGLGLIVVDYLQLMQSPNGGGNRVQEVSEISRSLKALAKELHVPVIALSQLNRNLEQRPNKRPLMSDLRDSGAVEQDSDLILFVYRDEVYHEDSPDKGVAELIIGKQRNGPLGTVRLTFLGEFTRFENFSQSQQDYS